MKRTVFIVLIIFTLLCLSNHGCKKSSGDVVLTVTGDDNVDGFPEAGTYSYDTDDLVFYNYTITKLFTNLKVILDNEEVPLQGTITMDRNHTLAFGCDEVDFSGNWVSDYIWRGDDCIVQPEDGRDEEITIIHSGDSLIFTFPSAGLTLRGGINGDGLFVVSFEEKNADGLTYEYEASGTFVAPDRFEGRLEIDGYWDFQNYSCFSRASFSGIKK